MEWFFLCFIGLASWTLLEALTSWILFSLQLTAFWHHGFCIFRTFYHIPGKKWKFKFVDFNCQWYHNTPWKSQNLFSQNINFAKISWNQRIRKQTMQLMFSRNFSSESKFRIFHKSFVLRNFPSNQKGSACMANLIGI